MDFTPSKYQQKILDCFTNTNENILVNALAGSGKSSTICLLTEHIDKSSIYIAFNASVVDEFKKKIKNPKVKVMTMHSLAYSIMLYNVERESQKDEKPKGFGRQRSKKEVHLDNFKPYKILDDELTKRYGRYMDFSRRVFYKEQYVSLYNLCCLTMTDMSSMTDVDRLIDDHTLFVSFGEEDFPKPSIREITETLKILDTKSKQTFETDGSISFTEMLYITYWKIKNKDWEVPYWAQYTNVMVDEGQDLSKLQLSFLPFIKRKNGRYVFVLDKNQAIYGFAGGDTNAWSSIPHLFAPMSSFDLPVCYRCAKSHLRKVNKLFGIPIKPRDDAPEGFVKNIDKDEIVNYAEPGDMIVSRKNKWLADCILSLAKNGIPVYMEDKAMVDDIKKIITKAKCTSIRGLKSHLEKAITSYYDKVKKLATKKAESVEDNEKKAEEVADATSKIDNINFLNAILKSYIKAGNSLSTTTENFTKYVTNLLNVVPSPDCVRICSVHKAKGLEAENVFVLNEGKVAYDFRQSKEQNVQEKNLSYISMTRAKNGLYLVKEPTKANTIKRGDSLNGSLYFLPDLESSERGMKEAIVNETFRGRMYGETKQLKKDLMF